MAKSGATESEASTSNSGSTVNPARLARIRLAMIENDSENRAQCVRVVGTELDFVRNVDSITSERCSFTEGIRNTDTIRP
jgi:hypothetical protein